MSCRYALYKMRMAIAGRVSAEPSGVSRERGSVRRRGAKDRNGSPSGVQSRRVRERCIPDSFQRDIGMIVAREMQLQDAYTEVRQGLVDAESWGSSRQRDVFAGRVWRVKMLLWLHGFRVPSQTRPAGPSAGDRLQARLHRLWLVGLAVLLGSLGYALDTTIESLTSDIPSFEGNQVTQDGEDVKENQREYRIDRYVRRRSGIVGLDDEADRSNGLDGDGVL